MDIASGLLVSPTRWPQASTLDGEQVVLCERTHGPWVSIIHALPDIGWLVPENAEQHAREFARFFPGIAADCTLECVALTAQRAMVQTSTGPMPAMVLVLSGQERAVTMMLHRWGDYLWERGPLFSRRERETIMHVPLTMPFDAPNLTFFPHVRFLPHLFDLTRFAKIARAPFATFKGEVCRPMLACMDLADDAHVALFALRTN